MSLTTLTDSLADPHDLDASAPPPADQSTIPYRVHLANDQQDLEAAQRLRYRVFARECGAQLASGDSGLDRDPFDSYCDHLLVRSLESGQVVGTYRILTFEQARRAGGFYSANEFDLRRIAALSPRMVELGRACVDPTHRDGIVISLLWAGLFDYLSARRCEYVIGCGSVNVAGDNDVAVRVCNRLKHHRLAPADWRVFPYRPYPLDSDVTDPAATVPPLMKGYLRLGAMVCGDPAWDQHFGTADFLMLLPMAGISPRHVKGLRRRAERVRE
ncbi:MAG TPA: GNAT family N-acyltransferase [Candidatus Binatia bacterium]|nr:GNAT family N-acyltransferase [Candidatus Binatia bacterium]